MKQKEMIQLAVAILIIVGAGYFIFTQMGPSRSAKKTPPSYEKISKLKNPEFNTKALDMLTDQSKVVDFYTAPDLKSGLGNSQPFGPIQ